MVLYKYVYHGCLLRVSISNLDLILQRLFHPLWSLSLFGLFLYWWSIFQSYNWLFCFFLCNGCNCLITGFCKRELQLFFLCVCVHLVSAFHSIKRDHSGAFYHIYSPVSFWDNLTTMTSQMQQKRRKIVSPQAQFFLCSSHFIF